MYVVLIAIVGVARTQELFQGHRSCFKIHRGFLAAVLLCPGLTVVMRKSTSSGQTFSMACPLPLSDL